MNQDTSPQDTLFSRPDAFLASGGVVIRQTSGGVQIAVIHRPAYNDWTLPKGKVKDQESLQDAARREVLEETKCKARITDFAGISRYTINGIPKIVIYWNMVLDAEYEFKPDKETDKLLWLSPKKAKHQLTHKSEKELIAEVFRIGSPVSKLSQWISTIMCRFRIKNMRLDRLKSSVDVYRIELKHRRKCLKYDETKTCWIEASQALMRAADEAIEQRDIDAGWKCFHAAQRMEIFVLEKKELITQALLVLEESVKISDWRKKGTEIILGRDDLLRKDDSQITAGQVYRATELQHQHFDNMYNKIGLLIGQLKILAVIFTAIILLIICFANLKSMPPLQETVNDNWSMMILVIFFGLLGGTISSFLSIMKTSTGSTIPQQIANWPITLMRVLVGGASAMVIYVLVRSELYATVINFQIEKTATILIVAFAAGFSERLVQRAIHSIANGKSQK